MNALPDHNSEKKAKFDPVKLIGQLFSYTRHFRLMLIMVAVGFTAGSVYFFFSRPTYRSTSLIYAHSYNTPVSTVEMPSTGRAISRAFLLQFRSRLIQLGAAKRLGLFGENATYEDLLFQVPAVRISVYDSNHLEVTVFAYEPEVVRNFAQALVDEYVAFQAASWEEHQAKALDRYQEQMLELEEKITENIEQLTTLEREQNITEITIEQQNLLNIPKDLVQSRERLTRMREIDRRLASRNTQSVEALSTAQIIAELSELGSFEKETSVEVGDVLPTNLQGSARTTVTNPDPSGVVVQPAEVEGIEPWRDLEKEHRIVQEQIQLASQKYLPEHPEMKELTNQLNEIERGLATELEVLRRKFDREMVKTEEKVANLEERMPEFYEVTEMLGKSSIAYSRINAAKAMWDKARERLATKLDVITMNDEFDWVEMRFKSHLSLRDQVPVSPSKSKLAMLSLIVAAAGALGLPTLLNLFDTSAKTIPELEDYTGIRGIGIVPLTSKEFLEEVSRSPAQGATVPNYLLECFRVIRSNICLHPNHRSRSQVVLVTSARPQEGKTTQAANLAWAFHSMGEKTLLLDCDLRRGRVHGVVDIDNYPGMTHMLMGDCPPSEAIVPAAAGTFDVIPRGPVIAGTTEILCQQPFEQLIEKFRKVYDRIVIDSPPVLGLSESSSLQRLVDGTVLVIRAEKTPRKDVGDALTLLKKSDAYFFGFVLNAVDLSKASNYYYYYYYSAPYYDQFEPEKDGPISRESDPTNENEGRLTFVTKATARQSKSEQEPTSQGPPRSNTHV